EAERQADALIADLEQHNFGYALPKLYGADIDKINELRKAGLGLLGSIVGDDKAADSIEDTAVELSDLPNYIAEFAAMMKKHGQDAIYYAHAGAGELHLRPVLNLKKKEDLQLFRTIATEVAVLVKKYRGSLSGEHGDGIVRGEFLPYMIGDSNYELLKRIKKAFDPNAIFNKGRITDTPKMDENLRVESGRVEPEIATIQDFSDSMGILRAAEKCNGSGDCRKLPSAGGNLCPSYRATRNEKDTTRARANALRQYLTDSDKENKFDQEELYQVFDLCVSCKACASECPSNVDIASMKAEFLYQYQKANGFSNRNKTFAYNAKLNNLGSLTPRLTNWFTNLSFVKKKMGIAPQRIVPHLAPKTFRKWLDTHHKELEEGTYPNGQVILFCDEFTNFYDVGVGVDTYELLTKLGYQVVVVDHQESGRAFISKGFLEQAKAIATINVDIFKDLVTDAIPLVGIEPSAILTFRDEYLRLAEDKQGAEQLAKQVFTIEEFFKNEITKGVIRPEQFSDEVKEIKIHGHCHQKALSTVEATFAMLNLPVNNKVTIYNSGCCGMAGSFGYEEEHYEISMQMGEDTLFPKIRATDQKVAIAAAGTSCRHQIFDGTSRTAQHPVTILKSCLKLFTLLNTIYTMALKGLFRKKTVHDIMKQVEQNESDGHAALGKHLTARDLTAFGIAAIVGAGIFSTIGKASADGGPAVIFLFLFTALACSFAAFAYAEFASMVPVSGSAYTYSYVAFGEIIAWIIGWALIMEYAVGNITVAISWSDYFTGLLRSTGLDLPQWIQMVNPLTT
ncbi:MAG: hypothetical protein RLZZ577_1870, partial [Bacteroidota bacterium]